MEEQQEFLEGTELPMEGSGTETQQEPDFSDFVRHYPDLDPGTIPQSVWDAVKGGDSLLHAYRGHEVQQLRKDNQRLQEQLQILGQNEENRRRSLGSVHSAGRASRTDGFLLGFEQA